MKFVKFTACQFNNIIGYRQHCSQELVRLNVYQIVAIFEYRFNPTYTVLHMSNGESFIVYAYEAEFLTKDIA